MNSYMKHNKLWLLFLGRLETEKGFDLIFDFIDQYSEKELPFEIYIFWTWSYEAWILELSHRFKDVHYFWWKPLSAVERYLENIDYCLMPSRFIETFWLSAINVLKWWIPVVGFKKWWLVPFIPDEYAIDKCKWDTEALQFSEMISKLEKEKQDNDFHFYEKLAEKSKWIALKYSKERWYERFQKLAFDFKVKKIVLVSDFINKVWWIETYIHDVKALLESHWYEVVLYWSTCPKWILGKIKKLLWIWIWCFNLYEAIKFYSFIKKEKPDLIWYNSMIRWLGWMPLWMTRNVKVKRWMMYHDFWYFVPYPHALFETKGIEELTLKNYLKHANTKNPLKWLLIMWKYFSLNLLVKVLKKQIDLHLVPSEFMVPIVAKSFWIDEDKVKYFNHFLQD